MTTQSNSQDYFRAVDISSAPTWSSADELTRQGVRAFARRNGSDVTARSSAAVRFHGPAVRRNRVSVRRATKVLNALQDALTAVAASVSGSVGTRGKFPELARQLTELQLSPQFSPGSVVFNVTAPDPREIEPSSQEALIQQDSLVDASAKRLLELISLAADDQASASGLVASLRELGPRVSRQMLILTKAIVEESLEIDVLWSLANLDSRAARISTATAGIINEVITTNNISADIVELRGILATVSSFRNIDLRLASSEIVTLGLDEDVRETLRDLYEHEVIVTAEEIVEERPFGETRRTLRALAVVPVMSRPSE